MAAKTKAARKGQNKTAANKRGAAKTVGAAKTKTNSSAPRAPRGETYDKALTKRAFDLASDGKTDEQIAKTLKVSVHRAIIAKLAGEYANKVIKTLNAAAVKKAREEGYSWLRIAARVAAGGSPEPSIARLKALAEEAGAPTDGKVSRKSSGPRKPGASRAKSANKGRSRPRSRS